MLSTLLKIWIFICFSLIGFLSLFINTANPQEPLVISSIASGQGKDKPIGPLQLFREMGIIYKGGSPCLELEEYTDKYCTIHGIKSAVKKIPMSKIDETFFKGALKIKHPCFAIAMRIGQLCELENFKKIIKRFVLPE